MATEFISRVENEAESVIKFYGSDARRFALVNAD